MGYAYLCDGVSPASPVLSDGLLSFTPGISQTLGTPNGSGGFTYASHFYVADGLGNLRGMSDGGGQGFPDAYNWDAFGQLIGRAGGTSTPFGYGEASGYQADGDSGLRLLGHRYYDSRTGRFISQDPAGSGDNWYAYCGNDPIDVADPSGLMPGGSSPPPFEQMLQAGGISEATAFAGMGSTSAYKALDTYKYYSVDQIKYVIATGQILSTTHLFNFAIPSGADIYFNYRNALADRRADAWYNKKVTEAYFRGSKGNGIAQGTTGDYKDGNLPGSLTPRLRNELKKLLDHGGNFNGGMVAEGYGTMAWENEIIGGYAKAKSDGRIFEMDDRTGQFIFSTGWELGRQSDPLTHGF